MKNARRLLVIALLGFCITLSSCASTNTPPLAAETELPQRLALSGEQILSVFAGVRDDASIQDAAGTTAVNHWYRDGRFINRWKNATDSGEVTGRWRVVGNKRCVLISAGLAGAIGKEKCSPVFKAGERYMSINADGSVHAFHTLTPMLDKP